MFMEATEREPHMTDRPADGYRYRTAKTVILYASIVAEFGTATLDEIHRTYRDNIGRNCMRTTQRYLQTLDALGIVSWNGSDDVTFLGWPE